MPSPEGLSTVFWASCTIACVGFLSLVAQTIFRLRGKPDGTVDRLVKLSEVTTDDEAQEPTHPTSQPSGRVDAEPGPEPPGADCREAPTRLLDDLMDFLNSEFQAARPLDTTPEITSAVCAYLSAAGNLLMLHRGPRGSGSTTTNVRMTDQGLNLAAGRIVQHAAAETASLGALGDVTRRPGLAAVFLTGSLSLAAAWTAVAAYSAERCPLAYPPVVRGDDTAAVTFIAACASPESDAGTMPPRLIVVALVASGVVNLAVPALVRRFTDDEEVRLSFAYPAGVAISMAVPLLALGVHRGALAAGLMATVGLIATTCMAAVSSIGSSAYDEIASRWEVVDEQGSDEER
ncbi:hypothetical protein KVR01_010205 [Diaporthe batatas]|uniref:uncharacterized protein n=1 Tax=Diaporthe batatas TaxID=748121 RepID=UPI001D04461B|nr:uncharacterized protein KVR01_010205 [Diaporthe batatas]KAG8159568.1 hypothetical protein KVR01_010205 [Diaporthe batatas]